MYRIAIVDDDDVFCTTLQHYLESSADTMNIEIEPSIWHSGEDLYHSLM